MLESQFSQITLRVPLGQSILSQKNDEIKLAKPMKKEPRKASFPWDLGLLFVKPIKYALILQNIEIYNRK